MILFILCIVVLGAALSRATQVYELCKSSIFRKSYCKNKIYIEAADVEGGIHGFTCRIQFTVINKLMTIINLNSRINRKAHYAGSNSNCIVVNPSTSFDVLTFEFCAWVQLAITLGMSPTELPPSAPLPSEPQQAQ